MELRRILTAAIEAEGTTFRDYRTGTGEPGNFQLELLVYGRERRTLPALRDATGGDSRDRCADFRVLL